MKAERGKRMKTIDAGQFLKDGWTSKDVADVMEAIRGFAEVGAAVILWYKEAPKMYELFFGTELEKDGVTEKYVYVQKRNGMDDEVFELSDHPPAEEIADAIYQALRWAKRMEEVDNEN